MTGMLRGRRCQDGRADHLGIDPELSGGDTPLIR